MFTIDTSTSFGGRVAKQLADELILWLTTVGRSGAPHPNPVWFLWTGSEILVFSQRGKAKLHNIAANPSVAANFNATHTGGDIGVISGAALVDDKGPTDAERSAYDKKYTDQMAGLNMSPEEFHQEYPVLIRITPATLRGF
jgi:PPOX class probable F420-dependent enzyme